MLAASGIIKLWSEENSHRTDQVLKINDPKPMVEYVIKLEPSGYCFVPVRGWVRGDRFLALGEPRRAGGGNTKRDRPGA